MKCSCVNECLRDRENIYMPLYKTLCGKISLPFFLPSSLAPFPFTSYAQAADNILWRNKLVLICYVLLYDAVIFLHCGELYFIFFFPHRMAGSGVWIADASDEHE